MTTNDDLNQNGPMDEDEALDELLVSADAELLDQIQERVDPARVLNVLMAESEAERARYRQAGGGSAKSVRDRHLSVAGEQLAEADRGRGVGTKIEFTAQEAPCGKTVNGDHYLGDEDDGLVIRDEYYACGCRRIRHEYSDGSIQVRAIRHDGKPVKDVFGPDAAC